MFDFNQVVYHNTIIQWLIALGTWVLAFSILKIVKRVTVNRLRLVASRTETEWDDFAVELLQHTRSWFLLSVSAMLAVAGLEITIRFEKVLHSGFIVLMLFQALFWGRETIEFLIERKLKKMQGPNGQNDPSLLTTFVAIRFLSRLGLYVLVALLVLDNLGFDVTTLIAGLGVGGIAVALATQNILGDLFASLSIVLDKPFVVGDYIDLGAQKGWVDRIGLKSTRLIGTSGEQVVVSNNVLLSSSVQNFGRLSRRRVSLVLGVNYSTELSKLKKIPDLLRSIVAEHSLAIFDRAHFKSLGESSLNYEFVYFAETGDFPVFSQMEQSINLRIIEEFRKEGIEFAFPSRSLYIEKDSARAKA